jgi:alkylation response protein AidB-like acyl-CoA dehydrogenase
MPAQTNPSTSTTGMADASQVADVSDVADTTLPSAPVERVMAALRSTGLAALAELPGWADATEEAMAELLGGFANFVDKEIAPLDAIGDREGSRLDAATGRVRAPDGFRQAYQRYVEAQWQTAAFAEEYGGGGLPWSVGVAMQDLMNQASVALALCPMLTQSAIELFSHWGSAEQKARFLPKLVTGEWTGTMNLTEPDAGSDVGAVRTVARPAGDGTWLVSGTKIFITWGDHDLADNIVHLVLARTPGAAPGTRGLSLFAVPARLVGPDGQLGAINQLRCVALENKLGIHASPTCVMEFDGAVGELVGQEGGGIRAMFTMMNTARLSVGTEGVGLAERAYQVASAYAGQRRQGRLPGDPPERQVPIVAHPDVRRMLATMRALTDASRRIVYTTAHAIDVSRRHGEAEYRARAEALASFLVPVAKAWPTDVVNEVTSLAVQVHGGAGFVEDTGVAQLYRDARITAIYEGTNGIQAIDLAQRKLSLEPGSPARWLIGQVEQRIAQLHGARHDAEASALADGLAAWRQAADLLVDRRGSADLDLLAGATPFLSMTGGLVGGWLLAADLVGGGADPLLSRGTDRLVDSGTDRLVGSGTDPLVASGTDRLVASGAASSGDGSSARFFLIQLLPRFASALHAVQSTFADLAY